MTISNELVSAITQAVANCAAVLFKKHPPEQVLALKGDGVGGGYQMTPQTTPFFMVLS